MTLQAATARLMMNGSDGSSKNTSRELLEMFAVCYDDAKQIPDTAFKELTGCTDWDSSDIPGPCDLSEWHEY